MKTKRFDKKLMLQKKTIVNLNPEQMQVLQGKSGQLQCAYTDDDITCPTRGGNTCPITACI